MATKVPKAAIRRFYKLTDEALAVWQTDIRPWLKENESEMALMQRPDSIDDDVHGVAEWGRYFRAQALGVAAEVAAVEGRA